MKRILLIMNPCSGKKKGSRNLAAIVGIFNEAGYEVTVHMTAAQGDGTVVAKQRAQDFDIVVCAGGDGTFNEVVSGVIQSEAECPIGYIPCGSTNDFANSLGLSKNILQAARDIVTGKPVSYDVGQFDQRHFSYVASFGAFTKTSYATSQNVKNMLGHLAYILGGIKEIRSLHAYPVKLETAEGQVFEDDYLFGAISNSTSVGGILTLDPNLVDMNDGLFELLLVKCPANILELNECILALTKQNYNSRMLTFCPTRQVQITARPDMDWTLDGEHECGHDTVEVKNLHDAIRVIKNEPEVCR